MVWDFIGSRTIYRTLHDYVEIRIFFLLELKNIFQHLKRKFCIFTRSCNSFSLFLARSTCQCSSTLILSSRRIQPWQKQTLSPYLIHFLKLKKLRCLVYEGFQEKSLLVLLVDLRIDVVSTGFCLLNQRTDLPKIVNLNPLPVNETNSHGYCHLPHSGGRDIPAGCGWCETSKLNLKAVDSTLQGILGRSTKRHDIINEQSEGHNIY